MATRAARARELLVNFPTGWSQGFLALVGGGYGVYYGIKLVYFGASGFFFAEESEKERRREQYIQEAVEVRAGSNPVARGRKGRKMNA